MTIINILCEESVENSYGTHRNPSIHINLRNRERSRLSCTFCDSLDFILPFFLTMYDKLLYLVCGSAIVSVCHVMIVMRLNEIDFYGTKYTGWNGCWLPLSDTTEIVAL